MSFDIEKLVADCGGASALAQQLGVSRTTPYRWINQGMISSRMLARIKQCQPTITIDDYIEGNINEQRRSSERSSGISG